MASSTVLSVSSGSRGCHAQPTRTIAACKLAIGWSDARVFAASAMGTVSWVALDTAALNSFGVQQK
eukprot:2299139-Lingulodinium_polyedra.AAC.1